MTALTIIPSFMNCSSEDGLPKIMDRGIFIGILVIRGRVGRGEDHDRCLAAPFARSEMFQNLIAVALGKVEIQQQKVGTRDV